MKIPKIGYVLAVLVIFVAGVGAFLVGRYVVSDDAPAGAQIDSEETPTNPGETPDPANQPPPHPNVAARATAVAEESKKPMFTGTINGITFLGAGTPIPQSESAVCSEGDGRALESDDARSAVDQSPMKFDVPDLPSGLRLTEELATTCKDEVLHIGLVYRDEEDGRGVSIVRYKGEPFYPASVSEGRLEATTIAGRNAVIVKSLFGNDQTTIVMYDDEVTMWILIFERIDQDEAVKFAEGLE